MKPKLLIVEIWGLGDLVIATPFIRAASEQYDVTLVAKPFAQDLQPRLWPEVRVLPFVAPWTAFTGKYRLWQWPWRGLFRLRQQLADAQFDVGLSARWDPRDHFLLTLAGVRRRLGFPRAGSGLYLNQPVSKPANNAHRYEYWCALANALELKLPAREVIPVPPARKGQILVHTGAGQTVRVWPLERFRVVVRRLRERGYAVQVACDPDQRGWWLDMGEPDVATPLTITDLLRLTDAAGLFIGNDSGPGHLAATTGVPTFTIFGPQLPERFAPLNPAAEWIEGWACPHRPCSDYCRFSLAICLWDLSEETTWPRVERFVTRHSDRLVTVTPIVASSGWDANRQVRRPRTKILVFAHTPPPHHGQSYMVQLMLEGFGGDHRKRAHELSRNNTGTAHGIECYHVNSRLSKRLEDIGVFQPTKLFLVMFYCLEAIWCRFRHGVTNLYYIPAPGKESALYRDWMVMFLCRPFFKKIIFHWHAAGLAKWLETGVQIRARALTCHFLKNADLSIVLSNYNRPDAEKFSPKRVRVVGNGIPDPCPDFEQTVLPRHRARFAARQKLLAGQALGPVDLENTGGDPHRFNVLFLAHCTRGKGLFDTLDSVALANAHLTRIGSPIRAHLTVAGEFIDPREHVEFKQRIQQADLQLATGQPCVTQLGFVAGEAKKCAFAESDCFCFPTYYYAESFGLVVLEAMAFGLPIIASRWRSIPELMVPDYPGLIPPRDPQKIAEALVQMLSAASAEPLREHFLRHLTIEQHLSALAKAIHSIMQPVK